MSAEKILMTVSSPGAKPDLKSAAATLGVSLASVDAHFGVICVDPDRGLYAVKVTAEAAPSDRSAGATAKPYRGPFSNPRIETFGPRRK